MCIALELDESTTLVIDAGSGLFRLGLEAPTEAHRYLFLLSHVHWDHISGFPLFRPHMSPETRIELFTEMNPDWEEEFLGQMDGIHFPITRSDIAASVSVNSDVASTLKPYGLDISWLRLNHRGHCYGYRITNQAASFAYVTDHEIDAVYDVHASFEDLAEFCAGADVLIHDGQFTAAEITTKTGWGHSAIERVVELARKAGVSRLILCHHDPQRSDDEIDEIVNRLSQELTQAGSSLVCEAAYEGMVVNF